MIDNIHLPRGVPFALPPGSRSFKEGDRPTAINGRGNIFINQGRFAPETSDSQARNYQGQMIGKIFLYDRQGQEVGQPFVVPLGDFHLLGRPDFLRAVVELVPTAKPGELQVVERRMETFGLMEDRAKYIYTLTPEAKKLFEEQVIDPDWILKDGRIDVFADRVEITYQPAGQPRSVLSLPADSFRDNFGQPLLANPQVDVGRPEDIYQSPFYTEETRDYQPQLDIVNGNLRLIVHKVKTAERCQLPEEAQQAIQAQISATGAVTYKVFPAAADLAVQVNEEWIPIALKEPLKNLDKIDLNLSQVLEGIYRSAIGPQARFGEPGNISSDYLRDPYFYGLMIFAMFRTIYQWGENMALNRDKAINGDRGIESGRTMMTPRDMLLNALADVLETNNEFYVKLTNFAEELWPPGVSEDTQMEMGYFIKGMKMWVVKEMIALMAAEKEHGNYDKQNTQRYNYSEVLFYLGFTLSKSDIIEARFLGKKTPLWRWGTMSELIAGRTWYKWAYAKVSETIAIPSFLATFGHVLCYPVDLVGFMATWGFRTVASAINYTRHLTALGFGFISGFWKHPSLELTFTPGYLKTAVNQFLYKYQFGTFQTTVGGTGKAIPTDYKAMVYGAAITTITTVLGFAATLALGGLGFWLVLPAGLLTLTVGSALVSKGVNHNKLSRRIAYILGGAALAGAGGLFALMGTPALFSYISIAAIANITFGLYQSGVFLRAWREMRTATRIQKGGIVKKALDPADAQAHAAILNELTQKRFDLSYQDLTAQKEVLRQILIKIDVINQRGHRRLGLEHPYRTAGQELLATYAIIESTIIQKAIRELNIDSQNAAARTAFIQQLKETREYVVIERAAQMFRQLDLKLEPSVGERIKSFFSKRPKP